MKRLPHLLTTASAAVFFGLSHSALWADAAAAPPSLHFTTGLVGEQACVQFPAQPGVEYVIQKSSSLGSFTPVAVVRAEGTTCQWVDPAGGSTRAFYQVPEPPPRILSLDPPVLSTAGGEILVHGQCLPAGAQLRLTFLNGLPPMTMPLTPVAGQPGVWRAMAGPLAGVSSAQATVSVVSSAGFVITVMQDNIVELTENFLAVDSPPGLAPAAPGSLCALWASKRGYDYYKAQSDMSAAGATANPFVAVLTDAKVTPVLLDLLGKPLKPHGYSRTAPGLPGEATLEVCPMELETPAGPQLPLILTYRSMVPSGSTASFGPNWTSGYDVSITPVPSTAGAAATQVRVCDGAGRCDTYLRQSSGEFTCAGTFCVGTFAGVVFTMTFPDHGKWSFRPLDGSPSAGKLLSICDRNDQCLTCTYDTTGLLAVVSSGFGQSLTFTRTNGLISRCMDQTGRSCSFTYFKSNAPGGNAGMLQSCFPPTVAGVAPVAGPTTFTYTKGCASARCDDNLLTCRDGAGRLLCAYTYTAQTNPLAADYDCIYSARSSDDATIPPSMWSYTPVGNTLVICINDPLGFVGKFATTRDFQVVEIDDYTGRAVPGVPVTPTSNQPTGQLRATDPDCYETTFTYNAQHLCTRRTDHSGLQTRCTYTCDLDRNCPVLERGNLRIETLHTATGEERTCTMDYLPGWGTCAGAEAIGHRVKTAYIEASARVASVDSFTWKQSMAGSGGMNDDCDDFTVRNTGEVTTGALRSSVADDSDFPVTESAKFLGTLLKHTSSQQSHRRVVSGSIVQDDSDTSGHSSVGYFKNIVTNNGNANDTFCTRLTTTLGQQFTWDFDAHGNCVAVISPMAGAGRLCTYNTLGQLTACKTLNGPDSYFRDECLYDATTHYCTSVICDKKEDGSGLKRTGGCIRNPFGKPTTITDARGFSTTITYNALDQITSITSPPVGTNAATAAGLTTTFHYDNGALCDRQECDHRDATGALVSSNPAYTTFFIRDSLACPLAVSVVACENRPMTFPVSFVPTSLADLQSSGLGNFDVCISTFDGAGQCVQQRCPAECLAQPVDQVCICTYDERGLPFTCTTGALGTADAVTQQCDYTPAGDLARGVTLGSTPAQSPTETYEYDGFQRCLRLQDAMGNAEVRTYDNQGYVTCDLYGQAVDVPGGTGNVLLSSCKLKVWQLMQGQNGSSAMRWTPVVPKPQQDLSQVSSGVAIPKFLDYMRKSKRCEAEVHVNMVCKGINERGLKYAEDCASTFFDLYTQDDVTTERKIVNGQFTGGPGTVTLARTAHYSPAGLLETVSCNGDLLETNAYDTDGRLHQRTYVASHFILELDACSNIISCARTDHSSVAGSAGQTFTTTCVVDPLGRCVQTTQGGNVESCDLDSCDRLTRYTPAAGAPIVCDYDGLTTAGPYSVRTQCDIDGNGTLETLGSSYTRKHIANFKWTAGKATVGMGMEKFWLLSTHAHNSSGGLCAAGTCFTVTNMGGVCTGARSTTDANGSTTTFSCDSAGRCVLTNYADGTHESCAFDVLGRPVDCVRRNGAIVHADFDLKGRCVSESCDDGNSAVVPVPPTTYTYNGRGDGLSRTQGTASITCDFDSFGNLLSETQNGRTVSHTYSQRGCLSTTYPNGAVYLCDRDAGGRCLSVSAVGASAPISMMTYLGMRLSSEKRADCLTTACIYRGDGEAPAGLPAADRSFDAGVISTISNATGGVLSSTICARNAAQCVIGELTKFSSADTTVAPLRNHQITLDGLNRVIRERIQVRATQGGATVVETDEPFTLNTVGQRVLVAGGLNPGAYTQLSSSPPADLQALQYTTWAGGRALTWDDQGSLLTMATGTATTPPLSFVYDARSRLSSVSRGGLPLAAYSYDACDRLLSRRLYTSTQAPFTFTDTIFVYDGARCIQELSGTGAPQMTFAAMGLCIIPINGDPIYPHGGGTSSASLLCNSAGQPSERLDRDQACRPIFLTSTGTLRAGATTALSGLRWLVPDCAWCPESSLYACPGSTYSPVLGETVSKTKERVKALPEKKEFVGHVSLLK